MTIIEVYEGDIEEGEINSATKCPIALAAARHYPEHVIRVNAGWIWMKHKTDERLSRRHPVDDEIRKFTDDFDCDAAVFPMAIGIPDKNGGLAKKRRW